MYTVLKMGHWIVLSDLHSHGISTQLNTSGRFWKTYWAALSTTIIITVFDGVRPSSKFWEICGIALGFRYIKEEYWSHTRRVSVLGPNHTVTLSAAFMVSAGKPKQLLKSGLYVPRAAEKGVNSVGSALWALWAAETREGGCRRLQHEQRKMWWVHRMEGGSLLSICSWKETSSD